MSTLPGMTISGSQNKLKEKVDLAFVIDTTGSMGPYIDNVKRNISDFAVYLEEKGIELRIGIIEYRDISADGIDSTNVHKLKGSTWHYSTKDMIETLGKLNVDGGGDTPETVIDGLGYLVDDKNTMLWSSQAYKFAVVLTDANYKVANTHGIANMNEMIDLLVKNDINTSVITRTSYKNSYNSLIEKTGGIFANILSSNFSNELKVLADSILNRTKIKKAIYVLPGYLGSELYINTTDNVPMWMNEFGVIIDAVSYYIYKRFGNLVYKKLTGENYDGPILGLDSDGSGEKMFAKPPYKGAYGVYDIYEDLIKKLESEFISTNIYNAEVLNDICDLIHKVNKNNSVRSFSNESFLDTKIMSFDENEDLGMSKYVKLYMESPQNVEVFIEDKDGNVVASIRNVKNTFVFDGEEYTFSYVETEGFDKEGFSFYSTASDFEEGLNAIIYIPNGGYKVVFKYLGDEDLQFGTEISTLNKDGEVTASATYFKYDKDETGHVITLDMTEKEVTPENIGSLSEKEADEAVKYNVDWEIDHRLDLTKIGESKKINITGEVASKVSWSSSSEEIVTVSEEGEVTAKGYGRAIVSATDGNIILKCIVTVSKEAKSIYVDDIIMQPGERVVIEPKFDSDDVIEEKITYEYDKNSGIIEINEYGVITGLSEGTVQVTAKTSKGIKTKFNVTVAKRGII